MQQTYELLLWTQLQILISDPFLTFLSYDIHVSVSSSTKTSENRCYNSYNETVEQARETTRLIDAPWVESVRHTIPDVTIVVDTRQLETLCLARGCVVACGQIVA